MKIAFLIYPEAALSLRRNGIVNQALVWKRGLEEAGHNVILISGWSDVDWSHFEIIHVFGFGQWLKNIVLSPMLMDKKIMVSPIIDSNLNRTLYSFRAKFGYLLMITPSVCFLRELKDRIEVLCRSEHELKYLLAVGFANDRISKVHLPHMGLDSIDGELLLNKEEFCFHLSSIGQKRKNVIRLILAAVKYNFTLVLAGRLARGGEYDKIIRLIQENSNICYLGEVSESEKVLLYKRAKVFALPSLMEGVGLVALDAYSLGCSLVLTNRGGPKEYFKYDDISLVDPKSIDSIGLAVLSEMNRKVSLQKRINWIESNNLDSSTCKLLRVYEKNKGY